MDHYGLIGNPIAHSKSPRIHQAFAKQFDLHIRYDAILCDPDKVTDTIQTLNQHHYRGLNVTVPFKRKIWSLCTHYTPIAKLVGAVNTLTFQGDNILGDTTDGIGLIRDLARNHEYNLGLHKVLLLGAGGAAMSAIPSLLEQNITSLTVANRTLARAQGLARRFQHFAEQQDCLLSPCSFQTLEKKEFDLIINATSAGLKGEALSLPNQLPLRTFCYDMMYPDDKELTPFLQWAAEHGAKHCSDGIGMLVEQAAQSFELWHGLKPETAPVIAELRK